MNILLLSIYFALSVVSNVYPNEQIVTEMYHNFGDCLINVQINLYGACSRTENTYHLTSKIRNKVMEKVEIKVMHL